MKRQINKRIALTLFFFTGLALGVWGYVLIMDRPLHKKGDNWTIQFDCVTGLTPSDPVTVHGIKVGRVISIDFLGDNVGVTVWISNQVTLRSSAVARIKPLGMIGEKYIDLKPGTLGPTLSPATVINGIYTPDLADSGDQLQEMIAASTQLINRLNASIDPKRLQRIQKNTEQASADLQHITKQVSSRSADILNRADSLMSTLAFLAGRHCTPLDSAMLALEHSAGKMPLLTNRMDSILVDVQMLTQGLKSGRGSAGRLLSDARLHDSAVETLARLDALIIDVQQHPGKYVRASLIGF